MAGPKAAAGLQRLRLRALQAQESGPAVPSARTWGPQFRVWSSTTSTYTVAKGIQTLYIFLYILHDDVHLFDQITVYIFCYALYVLYDV